VHVEEEKGPEKTSYPLPEVQTQEVPQKEKEVESVLDTKMLDALETRTNSSKDESGLDDPKEEAPQQEIDASTTDEKLSIESIPDAFISLGTQTPDE
jgi:hypothetical protein